MRMTDETAYCLGVFFNSDKSRIALVLKNRPEFQRGKYNSIGGKLEDGESAIDAMVREFREEAGAETTTDDWEHFATLTFGVGNIYCYTMAADLALKTMTDEFICWFDLNALPDNCMPNLSWLIPLALDFYREPKDVFVDYGK